jgi:hypothetical protein
MSTLIRGVAAALPVTRDLTPYVPETPVGVDPRRVARCSG